MAAARRLWRIPLFTVLYACYGVFALWCFGALCYGPFPEICNMAAAGVFLLLALTAPFLRPRKLFLTAAFLIMTVILFFWLMADATNERDWIPEYSRLPYFEWKHGGDAFRLSNIRDFTFRTTSDFDPRFVDWDLKVSDLSGLDYIVVHWDNPMGLWIAHSMIRFRFSDGRSFIVSCETRRTPQENYGAIPGLYHQFNLIYVIGTDADILALRTHAREPREQVYLYPTNAEKEQREAIFRDLAARVNRLAGNPQFYNTLTANCITSLLPSVSKGVDIPAKSYAYLFNGFSDRLAYELGFLKQLRPDESFEEVRERCHINPKVKDWNGDRTAYSGLFSTGESDSK